MKKLTILLFLFISIVSIPAQAQTQAEQEAYMRYMTPGEMQNMMAKAAGKWKSELKFWMAPGAPETKATGEYKSEMILGGRYLQEKHNATMMGMPFEGVGLFAYDNAKKVFINTWVDNMGTGIMVLEGKWDDKINGIEMKGKTTDPMTGKDVEVRQVIKFIDDNNSFMEMYMKPQGGQEYKSLEVKSKRD